jgi:3-isopropylmalate dehydrogenase
MASNKKLLVLPGDGIGPEVMREVRRVVEWMGRRRAVTFDIGEDLVGGAAIDARGVPITEETVARAREADAVLFGAVGGPKWDQLGFDRRPELAILTLRRELGLFANLRPAIVLDPLVNASTLKPEIVRGLDIMIVRESTGGIYFGEPRGVTTPAARLAEIDAAGASISASRGASRRCRTASSAASTRKSTPPGKSSASPGWPSIWPASGKAACAASRRRT